MNLGRTPEQEALADVVRSICRSRFTSERLRKGFDRSAWDELAQAGVFTLRLPEPDGAGLGMPEAVVVFEELGRHVVPGPVVWSELAAGAGLVGPAEIAGGLERPPAGPYVIEHLDAVDAVFVVGPHGLDRVDPADVDGRPFPALDPLTPVHVAGSLPAGVQVAGPGEAARWMREGAALTAAFLVGMSAAVTDLAVAYAKQRRQFGRPIGTFQAMKHLMADMLVRTEVARAAVYSAAALLGGFGEGDVERAVSAARLLATDAASCNAKACIQVHGGMGFTWEVDAHLYLKRAWVLDTVFGTADEHADRVAARILAGTSAEA